MAIPTIILRLGILGKEAYNPEALARIIFLVSIVTGDFAISSSSFLLPSSMLSVNSSKVFIGSTQISNDFPLTNIGDSVYITFDNDNQDVIDISTFKNKSFGK